MPSRVLCDTSALYAKFGLGWRQKAGKTTKRIDIDAIKECPERPAESDSSSFDAGRDGGEGGLEEIAARAMLGFRFGNELADSGVGTTAHVDKKTMDHIRVSGKHGDIAVGIAADKDGSRTVMGRGHPRVDTSHFSGFDRLNIGSVIHRLQTLARGKAQAEDLIRMEADTQFRPSGERQSAAPSFSRPYWSRTASCTTAVASSGVNPASSPGIHR